jgi:hypothetical protein
VIDSIALTNDTITTAWLPLHGVGPGRRGSVSVAVTFTGSADARVAMYAQGETPGPQNLKVSIFERTEALMPFPVFRGTLADLGRRTTFDDGIGRWTGHGDGHEHTVTYELIWSLPEDAEVPDDEPKPGLVWEARAL